MTLLNRIINYFLTTDGNTMIIRVALINLILVFLPVFIIPPQLDWFGDLSDFSRNSFFLYWIGLFVCLIKTWNQADSHFSDLAIDAFDEDYIERTDRFIRDKPMVSRWTALRFNPLYPFVIIYFFFRLIKKSFKK